MSVRGMDDESIYRISLIIEPREESASGKSPAPVQKKTESSKRRLLNIRFWSCKINWQRIIRSFKKLDQTI